MSDASSVAKCKQDLSRYDELPNYYCLPYRYYVEYIQEFHIINVAFNRSSREKIYIFEGNDNLIEKLASRQRLSCEASLTFHYLLMITYESSL